MSAHESRFRDVAGLLLLMAAGVALLAVAGAEPAPPPPAPGPRYGDVDVTQAPYSANGNWPADTADAAPAIQAALDASPGKVVYLPPGTYRCSGDLTVRATQSLVGAPVGRWFRQPTTLVFGLGLRGIVVLDDAHTGGGQETRVEDLVVRGLYKTTPLPAVLLGAGPLPPADGITAYAGVRISRCRVWGFRRHGIVVSAQTPETRANLWRVEDCQLDNNGLGGVGDGLHVEGGDANGGMALNVSSTANEGWGFFDGSSLGNVYVGCHARTDKAGAYCLGKGPSGVNATLAVGCYAEADCYRSELGDQCLWIGGTNATTITGGQFFLAGNARMRFQSGGGRVPPLTAMGNRALDGPALAVSNWAGGVTAAFSQDGTLSLGLAPGEVVPGQGQSPPPRLSIWGDGAQPAIKFGATKAGYVGQVGDVVASADGNGFGAGYVAHRTAGAGGKPVEALRLQNGRAAVGAGGLLLPATTRADRARLKPTPGLLVFDADERRVVVWDGDVWRPMAGRD